MTEVIETNGLPLGQVAAIEREIRAEAGKPLSVVIVGQTGVGKSSLLNTLFGANLRVGDVEPTTKLPEPVEVAGASGHPIVFWDMPGIGESAVADEGYLRMYRERIAHADIALWALHADTRSTLLDSQAIGQLLRGATEPERQALMAKLSFVLTKADLLTPTPWIYLRDGDEGKFVPTPSVRTRLEEKAAYFQSALIRPHGRLTSSQTYLGDGFDLRDRAFTADEHHVTFHGLMDDAALARYSGEHPHLADVFERLAANHRVLPVSAHFRYNLTALLVMIVNKLGDSAIGRFGRLVDGSRAFDTVPLATVRGFGNFVVWDKGRGAKTFDLEDAPL
jgi:hypothetical protein